MEQDIQGTKNEDMQEVDTYIDIPTIDMKRLITGLLQKGRRCLPSIPHQCQ